MNKAKLKLKKAIIIFLMANAILNAAPKNELNLSRNNTQKTRIEVTIKGFTYDEVKPICDYFGVAPDDSILLINYKQLENIPDQIQDILNNKGLTINFFKGWIKNHADSIKSTYRDIDVTELKKTRQSRFYDPNTNNIFISCDKYFNLELELHEYGPLVSGKNL